MLLTLLVTAFLASAAMVLLDEIFDWAANVIRGIANAVISALYFVKERIKSVFKLYTQTSDGRWIETTREVAESEIPEELRGITLGESVKISQWA
jgi:hypothetical protein